MGTGTEGVGRMHQPADRELLGIITLICDGKQYEATCSFPPEPSLKEGDKLRIMHRGPTVLVRRIINGKLDRVKFNLVFW
jgi:hypothetical protein